MARTVCTLMVLLHAAVGWAQAPPFEWVRQAGGPTTDCPTAIASDGSGNIFVIGGYRRTASFGTNTVNSGQNNGNDVAFLAKYAMDGNLAWVRSAGGQPGNNFFSRPLGLVVDAEGSAY